MDVGVEPKKPPTAASAARCGEGELRMIFWRDKRPTRIRSQLPMSRGCEAPVMNPPLVAAVSATAAPPTGCPTCSSRWRRRRRPPLRAPSPAAQAPQRAAHGALPRARTSADLYDIDPQRRGAGFEHVAYLLQCRRDGDRRCHVEAVNWLSSTVHAAWRRGEADAMSLAAAAARVPQTVGGSTSPLPSARSLRRHLQRFLRSVTAAPSTGVAVDSGGGGVGRRRRGP